MNTVSVTDQSICAVAATALLWIASTLCSLLYIILHRSVLTNAFARQRFHRPIEKYANFVCNRVSINLFYGKVKIETKIIGELESVTGVNRLVVTSFSN